MSNNKVQVGMIGSGWIGQNYANMFIKNGFDVIQYSLDPKFVGNKEKIKECRITLIAVPTPTTPEGFDYSIVENVLSLIGKGNIAVIKSTIQPGVTRRLQEKFPDITVLHSPEFLAEMTAAYDAEFPDRNVVGYVDDNDIRAAGEVMDILPEAPYEAIIPAEEAEMVKYAGNEFLWMKVLFANILFDLCERRGIQYDTVKKVIGFDPRIGHSHLSIKHKNGRGAGGHCFPKDSASFREMFEAVMTEGDKESLDVLYSLETLNRKLLTESEKDLDILEGIYGKE